MKVLCFLCFASIGFAQAPESVNGLIYRYREVPVPVGQINNSFVVSEAFSLKADGTYTQLYSIRWAFRSTPQWTYSEPVVGSYTYQKTSGTSAVLTMLPEGVGTPRSYGLNFTSALAGSLAISQTFQFSDPRASSPLANLSTRIFVPPGRSTVIGFVGDGEALRSVLIRAVGPGLSAYGVTGFLRNPRITVFQPVAIYSPQMNDDWEDGNSRASIERVQSMVGAFPLGGGSKDACLVVSLDQTSGGTSSRSLIVDSSESSDSGEVLIEVYLIP